MGGPVPLPSYVGVGLRVTRGNRFFKFGKTIGRMDVYESGMKMYLDHEPSLEK